MDEPKSTEAQEPGTLTLGEIHPAAKDAYRWLRTVRPETLATMMEAFASTALSGNRDAEIYGETLRRYLSGEPMSDRYLLGLCWAMRHIFKVNDDENK